MLFEDIFNRGILADHQIAELCVSTHQVKIYRSGNTMLSQLITATGDEHAEEVAKDIYRKYLLQTTDAFMVDTNPDPYTLSLVKFVDEPGDYPDGKLVYRPPMILPFVCEQVRTTEVVDSISLRTDGSGVNITPNQKRIISYGLSSYGYDFRVADEFKVFTNINSTMVDPLNFDDSSFVKVEGQGYCIVPPNSFVLARTVEKFNMPPDVVGVCTGKSTIARSGLSIMVTPLEPGWSGYLTLEYANTTPLPVKLYAGMGGGQIMFYRGAKPSVTYADRNGKYQDQPAEVVTPKV